MRPRSLCSSRLAKGPVAHGWPDPTWTLARIKTLMGRRFHKSMTLSVIAQMMRKAGRSIIMVLFPIAGAIAWRNPGKRSTSAGNQVPAE
ncbi:hypothetical protein EAO69_24230 [Streptomyces sp. me109]|nr:hypothetical protein EAO69_24230 [Streptomyces sp. me109]